MQTVQHCFAYTVMTDGSLAYQLKKKHRVPYSVFVRNTDINIFYKYFFWLRPLFHAILRDAEYINFPNPSYRDRLYERLDSKFVKQLHEKTRIIPNGIDDYWHENSLQVDKLKRPEGKPVRLLFVGKVETNKNVHSIVAALPRLNTDHNFHLTVIGPIAEDRKADVTRWCDELGDALSIKGPIYDKEQLLKEYRDADIFVMPSFTETFGLVFIEALTQGLPIIYTKGEGVSGFFVSVNNGLEIENPKDVDELASKIQRIVENYDHFSSHTLQSAKMFKWDNIILNYLQQVGNHENTKHN